MVPNPASRLRSNAALIIIDVQKGFDDPRWGRRNNPEAEANIARLLEAWRRSGRPVFHVQHSSRLRDSPLSPKAAGHVIKESVAPRRGEPVIKKSVNSAFIGTGLEKRLRRRGIRTVVVTGLTTDHCVATTARMAGNLGFETYVVSDATATFDREGADGKRYSAKEVHAVNLASLNQEFAKIVTTNALLELVR
jgi:nicotinamidase-related amidase